MSSMYRAEHKNPCGTYLRPKKCVKYYAKIGVENASLKSKDVQKGIALPTKGC